MPVLVEQDVQDVWSFLFWLVQPIHAVQPPPAVQIPPAVVQPPPPVQLPPAAQLQPPVLPPPPVRPPPYRCIGQGCNQHGDHYVRFRDSTGREGYHYLNANDTYYFIDTDKTQYYNDGCGYARLTCPSGLKIENRNSTFRLRHFDLMNFDFDLYLQEFQPNLERIKQNNAYYP